MPTLRLFLLARFTACRCQWRMLLSMNAPGTMIAMATAMSTRLSFECDLNLEELDHEEIPIGGEYDESGAQQHQGGPGFHP